MRDIPILFSVPMVLALMDGRKTQTRRILKPQPQLSGSVWTWKGCAWTDVSPRCPVGSLESPVDHLRWQVGDRLWVRETWFDTMSEPPIARYRADGEPTHVDIHWQSPSYMPRWASRLTLTVTDVRVQRIQEISEEDARAEGAEPMVYGVSGPDQEPPRSYRQGFVYVWRGIHAPNGPDGWVADPWVAAMSFTVENKNIDQVAP